jgi:activator of Hsp90 ATPase-like protein
MVAVAPAIENLTLSIEQEIRVRASLDKTFAALLEQMGPFNTGPDGAPMRMKLEAWPGGRWFRDLGDNNGHFWGVVQAIKKPTLLEISGPLFMSYPVTSNLQYRLKDVGGETVITFRHNAFGLIPDDHRIGLAEGWNHLHEAARKRAESA